MPCSRWLWCSRTAGRLPRAPFGAGLALGALRWTATASRPRMPAPGSVRGASLRSDVPPASDETSLLTCPLAPNGHVGHALRASFEQRQAASPAGARGWWTYLPLRFPELSSYVVVVRRWQLKAGTGYVLPFAQWKAAAFQILLIFNSLPFFFFILLDFLKR